MATVEKRGNSYRITVSAGYDIEGRQVRRTMTWRPEPGMTERQVQKELERQKALFENQVKAGQYMSGNVKFQEFTERWFTDYAATHLRERTIARYKQLAERTYQAIGFLRVDRIQPHHLLEFYAQLASPGVNRRTGGGLSPKTIRHYHTFISSVLDRAVKWQLIQDNPCKRIDAPKADRKEIDFMTPEEASRFLELLEDEPVESRAMFQLLLLTGIRRGELLGLEWKDIDWDNKSIDIVRTSLYTPEKGIFTDTTKTKGSQRRISVPQELLTVLKEYRAWQNENRLKLGDRWHNSDRLFTQWDGKPMHPNTPYGMLERFTKRHGLPHMTIHSLRHTNATLMISNATDVRTVAARLGHTQTSTTLNIYAHQLESTDQAAAESIAETLIRHKEQG